MKLTEQINEDIKAAMRAKDKITLEALRAAKTAFTLARTQEGSGGELNDDEAVKLLQKLVKQRMNAAAIYKEQQRDDLYRKEVEEADVLEKYLPAQMSSEELRDYLGNLISNLGATSMKDMGKVMGTATKELAGKADGKAISAIVREM